MEEFLPGYAKEQIDLQSLEVMKESYVEESLKKRLSDVVYKVKTKHDKERDAFVYCLLEHQSSSDYWMAFRLMQYSLLLLERHQNKKSKAKLPIIIPLVFYNGTKKYNAPRNIWELFDNPELAKKAMLGDYHLIDLQAMQDSDIDYNKHMSLLLYVMKHIMTRDTLKMIEEGMKKCNKAIILDKEKGYIHIKSIIWYTDSKIALNDKEKLEQIIIDHLPTKDSEDVMKTIADDYIAQGMKRGIAQGIERGMERGIAQGMERGISAGLNQGREESKLLIAKNLLAQKLPLKIISDATNISIDDLRKLEELQ